MNIFMNSSIKELEKEIEKLIQENKFKNGLISILSHDSKEIFGSFLWLIEAVEQNNITQEDFFKLLPQIKSDAQKNLQTTQDSTEWLKTQFGKFDIRIEEIKILDLFKNLKEHYAKVLQKKNINFQLIGNADLTLQTDRLLLEYVLDKLLNNALKYSSSDQTVYLQCSLEKNDYVISVIDSGIGMSKKKLDTILLFDSPVFEGTAGEKGVGLSLKIVDNFVSLMNGNMKISSSEDSGTTVSIFLPQI